MVLKVILNFFLKGRDRGVKGMERLAIGKKKKAQWMETGVWPWWISSHTEAHHWSAKVVGRDIHGGQCDGLFWRHSRGEWLESGDPEAAYQASVAKGETLKPLTEESERRRAELAARKEDARRGCGRGKGGKNDAVREGNRFVRSAARR